jgi:hypothetical protein
MQALLMNCRFRQPAIQQRQLLRRYVGTPMEPHAQARANVCDSRRGFESGIPAPQLHTCDPSGTGFSVSM